MAIVVIVIIAIILVLRLRPGVASAAPAAVPYYHAHVVGTCDVCGARALVEVPETDEELCADCFVEGEV